uniref:MAGI family member, X-linked n=1 Tax=Microcebus murinus TaxID=30608 RepID=A0A8C5XPL5_MICMU
MEPRAGGATDPRGSRGGRDPPLLAGPSAQQLLARLAARPLAARAAADVAALVRRAGATLYLRPKEAVSILDSTDLEVTDSRLPHPIAVGHQPQTLGTCSESPGVTQSKARHASKPSQTSGQLYVELVRGSTGFGLTLSGGGDVSGDAPLAVPGLLKDGPAQRCGRLQVGDLVLPINGESTQNLTHAQAVERTSALEVPGFAWCSTPLSRPIPASLRGCEVPSPADHISDPGEREVMRSHRSSNSPVQYPRSCTTHKTRDSLEPSPEVAAHGSAVPPTESLKEDPENRIPGSPGPWLVPRGERLLKALGASGAAQLAQEMSARRLRH